MCEEAIHNFKWVNIMQSNLSKRSQIFPNMADLRPVLRLVNLLDYYQKDCKSANTKRWTNDGLMLDQRRGLNV